jgi:hypothetical protein
VEPDAITEQRRLLAAIAAALLGSQGAPVWTRTAELLLLSSEQARRHYHRARVETEDILSAGSSQR